jgi:hypothetical protein
MITEVLSPMDESKTVDRGALHDYTLALLERIQGEFAKRSVVGEFVSLGTFGDLALLIAEYRDSDVDSPLDRLIDDAACEADLEVCVETDDCHSLTVCFGGDVPETFTVAPGLVFGETTDMSFGPAKHVKDPRPFGGIYEITFHTAWGLAASEPGYDKAKWSAVPEGLRQPSRTFIKWQALLAECDRPPVELRVCWSNPVHTAAVDALIKQIRDACPSIKSVEMQRIDGGGQFAASEKLCLWPYGVSDDRASVVLVTVSRRGCESSTVDVSSLIAGINSGEFA